MLPACLQALRFLAERDPAKCIVAMEFLDDLAESAPAIIVPHMQFVVELSLQFASNQQLQSELRVKATSIIGWLVRIKRKVKLTSVKNVSSNNSLIFYNKTVIESL